MVSAHYKVGDSVRCKASTYFGRAGVVTSVDFSNRIPNYVVKWSDGKEKLHTKNALCSESEFQALGGSFRKKQRVAGPDYGRVVVGYDSRDESSSSSDEERENSEDNSSDEDEGEVAR